MASTTETSSNETNGVNGHSANPICSVTDFISQSYDYVICGGGTAGLVLAARLTENPDVTVGVIEAGKYRIGDMLVDTPALFLQMLGNPDYDWMFKTTPQKANKGLVHHLPRGKLLGGSSGINYMMYVRGSDADYDDWAELLGDSSWSAKEVKKYMIKHQTLEPFDSTLDRSTRPFVEEHHGTSGPVRTGFNDFDLPIGVDIIQAADDVSGFTKKPLDPWSGDHIGFFNTLGSIVRTGPNKGKRSYAGRGYFEANKARPNLKVICEAHVNKVNLDGTTATGVNFSHGGNQYDVKSKKEVLVCGGAIQSPQILELSGIGDPEVLKAAGVDCLVELPGVGNNFQDHVVTGVGYELKSENMTFDSVYNPEVMAAAQKQLMETQNGPLTSISSVQGFFPYNLMATADELNSTIQSIKEAETKTEFERKQLDQIIAHLESDKSANLQLVLIPATANWKGGVENQAIIFPPPSSPEQLPGITMAICLQYPVSRGSIHISSSDPSKQPTIDPGYLKHPADRAILAAGVQFVDKMSRSQHLADKIANRSYPSSEIDLENLDNAKASAQDWCMGEYHACGSCAMGDVLDSKLKVKGVNGLRVVDASVFPNNVSGNICSSVYAVAEKAADMIKEEHH